MRSWQNVARQSTRALGTNTRDMPFAMLYLAEPDSGILTLAGSSGIDAGHQAAPATLKLANSAPWPLKAVLSSHQTQVVSDLDKLFTGDLPAGAWDRSPFQAAVLPIMATGETGRSGVLIVGLNPFRLFDENYRGFLGLVAGQIAAALANAQAYEEEKRRAEVLSELDRAKTTFFSNVSHEFRTPLTLMLGPIEELLATSKPADKSRAQLELVHRNGTRLLRLVNSLLRFLPNRGGTDAGKVLSRPTSAHFPAEDRRGIPGGVIEEGGPAFHGRLRKAVAAGLRGSRHVGKDPSESSLECLQVHDGRRDNGFSDGIRRPRGGSGVHRRHGNRDCPGRAIPLVRTLSSRRRRPRKKL